MQPETRYAKSGDVSIAYQVVGDGPVDLVLVPGLLSHLDLQWTDPAFTSFARRLSAFSRLILFDKRGTGLSDPSPHVPTLERRMEDILAVMDSAGCDRAALLGFSEGGPMSALFAGTYPDRCTALVMVSSYAKGTPTPEHPWAPLPAVFEAFLGAADHWGEGRTLEMMAPSIAGGELQRRLWGMFERASASPGMVRGLVEAVMQIDVTQVLPLIRVPTLVLHRDDELIPADCGKFMAKSIPGGRYVELQGVDHLPWVGDFHPLVDEIEEFLTGARDAREAERGLATVLFTDLVGSTKRASELGDRRWRELLEAHDEIVRAELARSQGRAVKTTGDGFLATFDGPARAIHCAQAITAEVDRLGIAVRAGVHTGECELMGDDIGGLAVHIGARVAAMATAGEVLVSSTVKDLVAGSRIEFSERGTHVLKGVPGEWRLFSVNPDGTSPHPGPPPSPDFSRQISATDRARVRVATSAPRTSRLLLRALRRGSNPARKRAPVSEGL